MEVFKFYSEDELLIINTIFQPKNNYPNEFNLRLLKSVIDTAQQPTETTQSRQLSDIEMDWYANYNQTDAVLWENVNNIYQPRGGTRNNFDSNICWQLPIGGVGFVVYNLNDLRKDYPLPHRRDFKDDYGYDQIGTKETIDAMIYVAKEWYVLNPNRRLQYGDILRPGGVNTPDHHTYNTGKAFDLRPIRNDSLVGDTAKVPSPNDRSYNRDLTREFIRLVRRLYPTNEFYYNDKQIYEDPEFRSFVTQQSGHNDHI